MVYAHIRHACRENDRLLAIAADSAGKSFSVDIQWTIAGNVNQGGYDFWIAKYDEVYPAVLAWVKQDGGGPEDGANGFEIVPDGQEAEHLTFIYADALSPLIRSRRTVRFLPKLPRRFPEIPVQYRNTPWILRWDPTTRRRRRHVGIERSGIDN